MKVSCSGFTLIELLVALTISVVLSSLSYSALSGFVSVKDEIQKHSLSNVDLVTVLSVLRDDLEELTIGSPHSKSSNGARYVYNDNGMLTISSNERSYSYKVDDGVLYRGVKSGPEKEKYLSKDVLYQNVESVQMKVYLARKGWVTVNEMRQRVSRDRMKGIMIIVYLGSGDSFRIVSVL